MMWHTKPFTRLFPTADIGEIAGDEEGHMTTIPIPTAFDSSDHIRKALAYCAAQAGTGEFAARSREIYDVLARNVGAELVLVERRKSGGTK